jgi:hypothetical protein
VVLPKAQGRGPNTHAEPTRAGLSGQEAAQRSSLPQRPTTVELGCSGRRHATTQLAIGTDESMPNEPCRVKRTRITWGRLLVHTILNRSAGAVPGGGARLRQTAPTGEVPGVARSTRRLPERSTHLKNRRLCCYSDTAGGSQRRVHNKMRHPCAHDHPDVGSWRDRWDRPPAQFPRRCGCPPPPARTRQQQPHRPPEPPRRCGLPPNDQPHPQT